MAKTAYKRFVRGVITVQNKDDGTVCGIDEIVIGWGEPISHLYYDQDTDAEMVAFRLLDAINNNTGSHWGIEHVCW